MLTITLYKNSILTDKYDEVFDTKCKDVNHADLTGSAFEEYLNSLDQTTIECGEVYATNSGVLNFDLKTSEKQYLYSYNYMKLVDSNLPIEIQTRYAFIDSITIVNTIANLSYTEDIWANYSNKIMFRKAFIERCRVPDRKNHRLGPVSLPMEFESNNNIVLDTLTKKTNNESFCYCIVKYQLYTSVKEGEVNDRHTYVGIFSDTQYESMGLEFHSTTFWAKNLDEFDSFLIGSTKNKCHLINGIGSQDNLYCDILNIYFVPTYFFPMWTEKEIIDKRFVGTGEGGSTIVTRGYITNITDMSPKYNQADFLETIYEYNQNDPVVYPAFDEFKTFAIGTINNPIEVKYNGTLPKIKIQMSRSLIDFKLYLSINNKLVDITKDYEYHFAVSLTSANVTQLAQLNRDMKEESNDIRKNNSIFGMTSSVVTTFASLIMLLTGNPMAIFGAVGGAMGIGHSVESYKEAINQRRLINSTDYTSNEAIKVDQCCVLNASAGLFFFSVVPDNLSDVEGSINETGYVLMSPIDFNPIFREEETSQYDVLKFAQITFSGAFPQDIHKKLEEILLRGFKIWYTKDINNGV